MSAHITSTNSCEPPSYSCARPLGGPFPNLSPFAGTAPIEGADKRRPFFLVLPSCVQEVGTHLSSRDRWEVEGLTGLQAGSGR